MKIAYVKDGNIAVEAFTQDVEVDFPHVVIDREILEPIETWYIEDGEIKIDQQKLIEFNRKNMPTLTLIEFDIKLVDAGLYDQVQDLISKDIKLKIAYTRATFFSRTDPFIDQARIALNLTDEQVDAMWVSPEPLILLKESK